MRRAVVLFGFHLWVLKANRARLFYEKDGTSNHLVIVYPTLETTGENGRQQIAFARSLRTTAQRAAPDAQVAGSLILGVDIVESVVRDGSLSEWHPASACDGSHRRRRHARQPRRSGAGGSESPALW